MKITRTTFTVTGNGRFPLDMLRYDTCWPTGLGANIADHLGRGTEIVGIGLATDNANAPTVGRWNSFGWAVIDIEKSPRP